MSKRIHIHHPDDLQRPLCRSRAWEMTIVSDPDRVDCTKCVRRMTKDPNKDLTAPHGAERGDHENQRSYWKSEKVQKRTW